MEVVDRTHQVVHAERGAERPRVVARALRVESGRHVHREHPPRSEGAHQQAECDARVHPAAHADEEAVLGATHMVEMAEPRDHAVADCGVLGLHGRHFARALARVVARHEQRFPPGRGAGDQGGVRCVRGGIAVEHEDVLAVVERADLVHVEQGKWGAAQNFTHGAVALVVLLPGPGRGGEVDDRLGAALAIHAQGVEHLTVVLVVLAPQVLAELHSEAELAAFPPRHPVGNQPVRDRAPRPGRELAERVKVPVVVEEAVVGLQGLRMRASGHSRGQAGTQDRVSVPAHVNRIELADPPVFAKPFGIERDVAVDHGDTLARRAQHLVPFRKIAH